ncbi:MAG: TRAP transporter large permease subunit [Kiritimatiellae bacterium]|nr:TRAP transporter large permease subunit [Kiritimatiellia bacterium]
MNANKGTTSPALRRASRLWLFLHSLENAVLALGLLAIPVLPLVEIVARRWFRTGIPGVTDYIQHLTLWVAFIGAVVTTRDEKHLKLAAISERLPKALRPAADLLASFAATAVCTALCGASLALIVAEAPALPQAAARFLPKVLVQWLEPFGLFQDGGLTQLADWMPIWIAESVMPIGFGLMAVRFMLRAGKTWRLRATAATAFVAAALLALWATPAAPALVGPGILLLVLATILGAPVFIMLGGAAVLLFWGAGVTAASIPSEAYRIVASPFLPTVPIFTLTGFVLSAGRADERLVRVFRAWFGWIPGGTAVAVTLLCAFFTTFTGASGVTILALGGLLLPVLLADGFGEKFSVGLLTATGSIGLLLPPSLVVILYGVVAGVPIVDVFKAALLPGVLLILPVIGACVVRGQRARVGRSSFVAREAWAALWAAKWDIPLPAIVLIAIFGGFCSLVEAAAITVVYALFIEAVVYRDVSPRRLVGVIVECGTLVGAVLIILGVAMGLTSYFVDAQVPMQAAAWATEHLHARWIFLLALNGALILVGCFMDIFSALVVVVPLVLPMARAFGVDPVHVGVIFIANLELGYLTPPVGMDLFLASVRFKKPLLRVARDALPFLLLMAVVVLLITYVPWLTLGVLELLRP